MTENTLLDSIEEMVTRHNAQIADLKFKNEFLARLACKYAVQLDLAKIRTPQEYAAYHGDMRRDNR